MNSKKCPLCAQETDEILSHHLRRGEGEVRYCPDCDHGYLVQRELLNIKEYYDEQYRQEYSHNSEVASTNPHELHEVYKKYQRDRLEHISPFLTEESRVLEVGASAGQFLIHIKNDVSEVNAIELEQACCEFLTNQLDIVADSEFLENSRFAGQLYDVVCAFQVMEHVEDPVQFLKSLHQATKKGGAIFVEVPNLRDSLLSVWGVPGYKEFFYHSAHLHYFTETSLVKVAADAGFRIDQLDITFTQDYNLLNHLHWIINNGPQADCHVGLSEISLCGPNENISSWLTEEVRALNRKYIDKLIASKATSNMMLQIRND